MVKTAVSERTNFFLLKLVFKMCISLSDKMQQKLYLKKLFFFTVAGAAGSRGFWLEMEPIFSVGSGSWKWNLSLLEA